MNVRGDSRIPTQHKHNSSDMQKMVGKFSGADSIQPQISSKTSPGKSRNQCGILCKIFNSAGIQTGFPPRNFNRAV